MRRLILATLILILGACNGQTSTWVRTDGRDIKSSVELQRQKEIDSTVCVGEAQKANLSAGVGPQFDPARDRAVIDVAKACMASRGYVNVPIELEEQKRREFAAQR